LDNGTKSAPVGHDRHLSSTVVVADDEAFTRQFFGMILQEEVHKYVELAGVAECISYLKSNNSPDLIILDIRFPDGSGLDLLKWIRDQGIDVPVIMVTAYGSISDAVLAVKMGAFDFLTKPFEDTNKIKISIKRALEYGWLEKENRMLREQHRSRDVFQGMIGNSEKMQHVYELVNRAAGAMTNVLIEGESGTGKDLVARAIHSLSDRKGRPFVPVNCGALPEGLLESALFGYEKGSFTGALKTTQGFFEEAHSGTLFLDEIGDAPASVQVKILRAVEDRVIYHVGSTKPVPLDVRLLFATNKDLTKEVAAGRFRSDLYYRINVLRILLPPLRERKEDIPGLIDSFLKDYCGESGMKKRSFTKDALSYLFSQSWPGNVRQLKNCILRIMVQHPGEVVNLDDLPLYLDEEDSPESESLYCNTYLEAKKSFEKRYFEKLLHRTGWDLNRAAKQSEMHLASIYRKLNALNIKVK
jgi:DNA-binding NtrC family response regulator